MAIQSVSEQTQKTKTKKKNTNYAVEKCTACFSSKFVLTII
jgi:hypothetical protein